MQHIYIYKYIYRVFTRREFCLSYEQLPERILQLRYILLRNCVLLRNWHLLIYYPITYHNYNTVNNLYRGKLLLVM